MSEGTTDSVEFFGVKLKVRDPRLAALLNSDVTDDVVVIGRRARGLVADGDGDGTESSQDERPAEDPRLPGGG